MDSLKKASIVSEKLALISGRLLSNGFVNMGSVIYPPQPPSLPRQRSSNRGV